VLRAALGIWFLLIVASTLLTHQHHLIDAVAALVLAALLCGIQWGQAKEVRA
jgi:membrane-associated phospholipid phosphatase